VKSRESLIKAYLDALGLKALMVLAVDGKQPSRIAFSEEKNLVLVDALFFVKAQHAELVLAHASDDLAAIGALRDGGWIDMAGRELRDIIANTAAYLGASFHAFAAVRSLAEKSVDHILVSVEAARVSGGLAKVNAEYKGYRKRQLATGQTAVTYSAHLAAFTRNLVTLAAQNANAAAELRRPDSNY